jgi:hypothetical protein
MPASSLTTLGWCEWLALPALGIAAIEAKLDTGARSSSLHVDSQELFERAGAPWVRFALHLGPGSEADPISAEAAVIDQREVRDSGGHVTRRVFIRTGLALAGQHFHIEINLAARRGLRYPMLLGRTALAGRFLIDSAHKHLLGERPL